MLGVAYSFIRNSFKILYKLGRAVPVILRRSASMSKILTLHEDGSKTVRTFHTCGDCSDCPYNNEVRVDGCSNVLPCGQYYCWDN